MKRHYYAASSAFGVRAVYNEDNPAHVHIFESKRARDEYVAEQSDIDGLSPKTEAISRDYLDYIRPHVCEVVNH